MDGLDGHDDGAGQAVLSRPVAVLGGSDSVSSLEDVVAGKRCSRRPDRLDFGLHRLPGTARDRGDVNLSWLRSDAQRRVPT
jgi:hypothetical protein